MLAREKRLRKERDIARVYHKGRYGRGANIQAKCLSTGLPTSRAAIVVSKKISKKAVVRNRIKRRLSAYLSGSWQTVKPGYDIVLTVRSDISAIPAAELATEVHSALRKAGALI
jgi:ribonuclease P protein component